MRVLIDKSELLYLLQRNNLLELLEDKGVDNWNGYGCFDYNEDKDDFEYAIQAEEEVEKYETVEEYTMTVKEALRLDTKRQIERDIDLISQLVSAKGITLDLRKGASIVLAELITMLENERFEWADYQMVKTKQFCLFQEFIVQKVKEVK